MYFEILYIRCLWIKNKFLVLVKIKLIFAAD